MASANPDTIVLRANSDSPIHLDYILLRKAVLVLRALNHKLRQSMIQLLEEGKRLTVTEIYVKLRLEQSVASQHLAILRRVGVVDTYRDGKYIYYTLNVDRLNELSDLIEKIVNK